MKEYGEQYLRTVKLIVFGADTDGLDLSQLRIKFAVKRSDTMTPNTADIRVYNLSPETAVRVRDEFRRVILEAGYEGNSGVIFQGNIKQVIIHRESATDTYIDIVAGDGDRAYNYSVVNTTLAPGSTQADQVAAAARPMAEKGTTLGPVANLTNERLPRGKVMYGPSKNFLKTVAQNNNQSWSIQDEKITFVSNSGFLPGQVVVITDKTGLIGSPQQTNEGVNLKCLLNPLIKIGGRVKLDNASVERLKINLNISSPDQIARSIPARINADGVYYVLVAEHVGDTRGVDWYTTLICLSTDVTTNPINSVRTNYGG